MLDARTPKGREWIELQGEVVAATALKWGTLAIETPPDGSADVDALFCRKGVLVGIAEVKARSLTMTNLQRFGSYLVTYDKLERGVRTATALQVPFALIVGLFPEGIIVFWHIWHPERGWLFPVDVRETRTQATCNGGEVVRPNAYLPLSHMRMVLGDGRRR